MVPAHPTKPLYCCLYLLASVCLLLVYLCFCSRSDQLRELFEQYGTIGDVYIPKPLRKYWWMLLSEKIYVSNVRDVMADCT
jgi:hypothetical protein